MDLRMPLVDFYGGLEGFAHELWLVGLHAPRHFTDRTSESDGKVAASTLQP